MIGRALILALALVSCEAAPPAPVLAGKSWTLIELGGEAAPTTSQPITLALNADRASGFSGCNTFSGAFRQTGAKVQFLELVATKMACADANVMAVESAYLEALSATATAHNDAGKLVLESAGGETLAVFAAQ